jgi:RNA polymerase sigma-70 factor (ECF subfamily)
MNYSLYLRSLFPHKASTVQYSNIISTELYLFTHLCIMNGNSYQAFKITPLNPHHKNEEELSRELQQIEAAKADPDEFSVLYEKYYKQIYVFIFRRTGHEALSADLCSLTFLKAMVNIGKYVNQGLPFSAWLFRIALNEVNMFYRKNKAERCVSLETKGVHNLAVESGENLFADDRKILMQALSQLKAEEMQLIELRFFEERPFSEVAGITGITENNAKVKIYRILDKLKILLKGSRK